MSVCKHWPEHDNTEEEAEAEDSLVKIEGLELRWVLGLQNESWTCRM